MISKIRVAPGLEGKWGACRAIAHAMGVLGLTLLGVQGSVSCRAAEAAAPSSSSAAEAAAPSSIRKSGGALMICGGGRLPEEIRDTFIELAGGREARIVIIPTAHALADAPGAELALEPWRAKAVAPVTRIHTRSREQADDPEFCRPLANATGVWIGGGKQTALTSAYLGTEVERQLKALLDRGGVIGGTSAGAAVMTQVMIASGRTEAVVARGFDFLPGAVVDQHFLKRRRARRLLGVVASHRDLIGFGIDEGTTLVISPSTGRLRVLGDSCVLACTADDATGSPRFERLKAGDETDLVVLRRPDRVIASPVDLEALVADQTSRRK